MIDWTSIFSSVGIFGLLVWFIKSLFKHMMNKDIEHFKSELEKAAIEHHITFKTLHEKRAIIISEIYKRLVNMYDSLQDAGCPAVFEGENPDDRIIRAWEATREYYRVYSENDIWLDINTSQIGEQIISKVGSILTDFRQFLINKSHADRFSNTDPFMSARKKIETELPELKNLLKNEFRGIIGSKI